jgi:hypothetical protein
MTNDIEEDLKPHGFLEHVGYYGGALILFSIKAIVIILGVIVAYKATLYIIDILKGWGWW